MRKKHGVVMAAGHFSANQSIEGRYCLHDEIVDDEIFACRSALITKESGV